MAAEPKRRVGRPRSEASRRAVLDAAFELAAEQGLSALTMEAIGRRAGVSKETLYRWWRSKGEILLEALAERGERVIPVPHRGELGGDLREFLLATQRALDERMQRVLRALASEAAAEPAFAEAVREKFLSRRRAELAALLQEAIERGELSSARATVALDLVYGSLWYRLLFAIGPLDRAWAESVADAVAALGEMPSREAGPRS